MDHLEDTPVQINGSIAAKAEKMRTFMLREASDGGEAPPSSTLNQPPAAPARSTCDGWRWELGTFLEDLPPCNRSRTLSGQSLGLRWKRFWLRAEERTGSGLGADWERTGSRTCRNFPEFLWIPLLRLTVHHRAPANRLLPPRLCHRRHLSRPFNETGRVSC